MSDLARKMAEKFDEWGSRARGPYLDGMTNAERLGGIAAKVADEHYAELVAAAKAIGPTQLSNTGNTLEYVFTGAIKKLRAALASLEATDA